MDGLLNYCKPPGISSARALDQVRRATHQRRSGHAGTLDPFADGVLLICLGKATKRVEKLMELAKGYRAVARLDVTSESFDIDRPLTPVTITHVPTIEEVAAALDSFRGVIEQTPPSVSALKLGGVPAYRRVLRGEVVQLAPRKVTIYEVNLLRYKFPEVEFSLTCGRGTYVRAVARDLGTRLGAGGCLTQLTRTAVGPFYCEDAIRLEQLSDAEVLQRSILPLDALDQRLADWRGPSI
jgi:tRNA pseudouridine55 synthase